jgi:glutathione S-transferase
MPSASASIDAASWLSSTTSTRSAELSRRRSAELTGAGVVVAGVLDGHLRDREWIARDYSIADIINYPWFDALSQFQPNALDGADALKARMRRMAARPAVL